MSYQIEQLFRAARLCSLLMLVSLMSVLFSCTGTPDYHKKLLAGAGYAGEIPPFDIGFTYAEPSDPGLAELRERFSLKAIAGNGTDRERILNLLVWAYEIVPWDGSAPWPEGVLSAQNIIEWSRKTGNGVNCRMKAIVLQEACLSVGIPARIVSCTPLDPNDSDSHVITAVWCEDTGSWVWMDPSFHAYPSNPSGRILGIRDVRQMLTERTFPKLNPEATIRGKEMTEEWYFGYYMMKNLYGLISPLEAVVGYEGSPGEKGQVILVHAGMLPEKPDDRIRIWTFRGGEYTQYMISNPDLFWEAP